MKLKINNFEFIVDEKKIIGVITEDKNNYSIIVKPENKIHNTLKKQVKK